MLPGHDKTGDLELADDEGDAEIDPSIDPGRPIGELAGMPAAEEEETIALDDAEDADETPPAARAKKPKKTKNKKLKVPNFERFRLLVAVAAVGLVGLIVAGIFLLSALPKATIAVKTDSTSVRANL